MSSNCQGHPLVTFALFAYKQEGFIREAVAGALAQTYSPLEIILSDDSSPDLTFEIMQEMAAQYQGSHKVILNRNPQNLGLGAHVNRVMEMARGELVVFSAGDDVSLPDRTARLTQKWLETGRPSGIGSGVIRINNAGERMPDLPAALPEPRSKDNLILPPDLLRLAQARKAYWLSGCAAAWSAETWKQFGPVHTDIFQEDVVLSFRAGLHRGLCVLEQPLVKYRIHGSNISINHKPEQISFASYKRFALNEEGHARRLYPVLLNHQADIVSARNRKCVSENLIEDLEKLTEVYLARNQVRQQWWSLGIFERIRHWDASPYVTWQRTAISVFGINFYSFALFLSEYLRAMKPGR